MASHTHLVLCKKRSPTPAFLGIMGESSTLKQTLELVKRAARSGAKYLHLR